MVRRHAHTNSHLYDSQEDFEIESDKEIYTPEGDTENNVESDETTSEDGNGLVETSNEDVGEALEEGV